jgi:hypothetical protein
VFGRQQEFFTPTSHLVTPGTAVLRGRSGYRVEVAFTLFVERSD